MNFFDHQDKARRQSRWIIWCFIGVTLLIVAAINVLVLTIFAVHASSEAAMSIGPLSSAFLHDNIGLVLGSSVATASIIGIASLGKIASLRGGGGKVARDMGGAIVTPDTRDPLRRRLYNVVEEIAIASGTSVPQVYVMENEPGINAFAAGYTAADAAIAVTQGTLEKLDRDELQGVIAHEFSHIFNGDMRINIRMMGVMFGILIIAIAGRKFLHSSRFRVSSSRDNNGGAIVLIGVGLMIIGYIGLFFARWMKSALSRQREYLADASAVQFTRDPDGIAGALKKIAAYNHSSYLREDSEEVSHMLFSSGYKTFMFATHPPLESRISRLEKGFKLDDIKGLAKQLREEERREHIQADKAERELEKKAALKQGGGFFDPEALIEQIGNPDFERIFAAGILTSQIPDGLNAAAHSLEWVPEVVFFCLLDRDPELSHKQQLLVNQTMGDLSANKLNHLLASNSPISEEQRLPLVEICFPTLKRRPIEDIRKVLRTIDLLVVIDNNIDSFEYCLSRLVRQYLLEATAPSATSLHGALNIKECVQEVSTVVSIVASNGQTKGGAQGIQNAQKAYRAGMSKLDINHTNLAFNEDWQSRLDAALKVLDKLNPQDKYQIVKALSAVVTQDGVVVNTEHELVRVVCALIHVPFPMIRTLAAQKEKAAKQSSPSKTQKR